MSLSDKIKANQIKAHELRGLAGPMFRQDPKEGSHHLTRSDMPPQWHTLHREAEHHERTASELRKKLSQPHP